MSEPEQELPERDPRSLLAEADYWRAILDDLRAINDATLAGASAACDIPVAMLELLLSPNVEPATDRAREAARAALDAFAAIGERVEAIGNLADGRLKMLIREGRLEE